MKRCWLLCCPLQDGRQNKKFKSYPFKLFFRDPLEREIAKHWKEAPVVHLSRPTMLTLHPRTKCFIMFKLIVLHINTCRWPHTLLDAVHRLMVWRFVLLLQPRTVSLQSEGSSKLQTNLYYTFRNLLKCSQSKFLSSSYSDLCVQIQICFHLQIYAQSTMQNVVHTYRCDWRKQRLRYVFVSNVGTRVPLYFLLCSQQSWQHGRLLTKTWQRRFSLVGGRNVTLDIAPLVSAGVVEGGGWSMAANHEVQRKAVGGEKLACALSVCAQQALHASPASFLFMFFERLCIISFPCALLLPLHPSPLPAKFCTAPPSHWVAGNRYVWARLVCEDRRRALGCRSAETCRSLKTSNHFQQLSAVKIRCRRDSRRHEREGVYRRERHSLPSSVSNVSPLTIRRDAVVSLSLFSLSIFLCHCFFFTHLSPPTFLCLSHVLAVLPSRCSHHHP